MARDSSIPLQRTMLTLLQQNSDVTALVAANSIQPFGEPVWPFIRSDAPAVVPLKASGVDGMIGEFAVHSFAKPRYNGSGAMIETAKDHAGRIGAAVANALDRQRLDLAAGFNTRATLIWRGGQLLPDPAEEDAYHSVQNFRARVLS